MNRRLIKPLIPPLGGRWERVGLTALLTATVAVGRRTQGHDNHRTKQVKPLNSTGI